MSFRIASSCLSSMRYSVGPAVRTSNCTIRKQDTSVQTSRAAGFCLRGVDIASIIIQVWTVEGSGLQLAQAYWLENEP